MPENNYPPKIEFELNKPTKIKLLYDKPIVGEGKYGIYYLYRVEKDREEYSWFAPTEIHQEISDKGYKQGDILVIYKTAIEENGKLKSKYELKNIQDISGTEFIPKEKEEEKNNVWEEKNKRITKMSVIRSAVELAKAKIETGSQLNSKDVLKVADEFFKWIYKK